MTNSKKLQLAIIEQGRKKSWVAKRLGISRPTLDKRIENNSFTDSEIMRLHELQLL